MFNTKLLLCLENSLQAHKEDLEKLVSKKTKALQASETLLQVTGRMAKIGGWELDIETKQLIWTDEVHHIHDLEDEPIPDLDSAVHFYHPDDQPVIAGLVKECIQNGIPYAEERYPKLRGKPKALPP